MTTAVVRRDTWGNATTPERSLAQRRAALDRANEVRVFRAKLKKDMTARRVSARDVLLEPPEFVGTMKVLDLLLAVPKVGRVKAGRVLRAAGVSPSRSVAGLSERQRSELLLRLGPWAG